MEPVLSTAQRALVDLVGDALDHHTGREGPAVWSALTRIGFVEFGIAESDGGLGLGQVELCLVFEEAGARLADVRQLVGAQLLLDLWQDADRHGAADAVRLMRSDAPAVEPGPGMLPWPLPTTGGARNKPGDGAALLLRAQEVDSEVVRLGLTALTPGGLPHVPDLLLSRERYAAVLDRHRLRAAAYLVGIGRRALTLSRDRAASREVGGRPLFEYQAAAHTVAGNAAALLAARLEVWEAAWHEDRSDATSSYRIPAALAVAAQCAIDNAKGCAQLFGAAGTSCAEVVQVYRQAHTAAACWGGAAALWQEAAVRRYQDAAARPVDA
jgi:alkylation response protein AidB-like acyl-CoA dehydrogenase